jgi:tRNA(Ile)-lysidine synthase
MIKKNKNVPDSINKVAKFIDANLLIVPHSTIIVGLSGGPDSVFLLHTLMQLRAVYDHAIIAAHLNHEWRASAINDENFCRQLCSQWAIPLVVAHASELAFPIKSNRSKEDIGRQMRRHFFEHVRHEHNAQHIALAHHGDDQIETFFIRLVRGASLVGLSGMRPKNGYYIRPLLTRSKQEILDYVHTNKLAYVVDPTNADHDFLRNRIRLQLMPLLTEIDARATVNLKKTMAHLQQASAFIQTHADQAYARCTINDTALDISATLALDPVLQKWIIIHWLTQHGVQYTPSTSLIEEIVRFLRNTKSTTHTVGTWCIRKRKNYATIEPVTNSTNLKNSNVNNQQ